MKDRFENLNKKKNKAMRKMCQQEGLEVQKGKPGRKKKTPHPSAIIPAIPEGETDDTYQEQKKRIGVEWNGLDFPHEKARNSHQEPAGVEDHGRFPKLWVKHGK